MNSLFGAIVAISLCLVVASGCASTPQSRSRDYRTVADDPQRNTEKARAENERGANLLDQEKFEAAEQAFRAALAADVMYGPAHNNLGKLFYLQKKFYLAAWEFQFAHKLMPHQPEPLNNLGLVFESTGRFSEAINWYGQARELEPDNPIFLGNLVRTHVRKGDPADQIRPLLQELVLKETRPDWRAWAQDRLSKLP